ncbi:unnamed protein product [Bursaphelenchus okinawaensis]|uniref:Uncharacterized protein n=1 Tax=Bursaphelenchus okinawaensis TaxID=465554 RepID=A0A811KPE5_9BILA|nr:unnamed protein product [Bursaphelenchus okinawaensis]CAG9110021.1 unnamed protein product [Bursaphelenchus okinawaensis]
MSILLPGANCSNFVCLNKTRCVVDELNNGIGCFRPQAKFQDYSAAEMVLWGAITICSAFTIASLICAAVLLLVSCFYVAQWLLTSTAQRYRAYVFRQDDLPTYSQAVRNRPK